MLPVKADEKEAVQLGLETGMVPITEPGQPDQAQGFESDAAVDANTLLGGDGSAKRRFPIETAIIIGVLAVAGGVIYGMRQIGVGPKASIAADATNLKLPERAAGAGDPNVLLADLTAARTSRQVPTERVKKNPFQLIGMTLVPAGPVTEENQSLAQMRAERERIEKAKAERLKSIEDEFKKLELVAVMGGSTPTARINGTLYRIGDKVGEFHTLKNVNSNLRNVELEANGKSVILAMPSVAGAKR
jgi:hypothetical protein